VHPQQWQLLVYGLSERHGGLQSDFSAQVNGYWVLGASSSATAGKTRGGFGSLGLSIHFQLPLVTLRDHF